MASRKITFTQKMQEHTATFMQICEELISLAAVYLDREYDSGGEDELHDADIESLNVTAADIEGMINFIDDLSTFLNDDKKLKKKANKIRNDY